MSIFDRIRNLPPTNETSNDGKITGKIIKLSDDGYGFITSIDIPFTRIFFHWTSLVQDTLNFKDLEEGMQVEFKVIDVPDKGKRAIKVKVIN